MRHFARAVGFLGLGLLIMTCAATAQAGCLKTRTFKIEANKQNGYGSTAGYPKLPLLRSGEYVLTFDDGPNPAVTPLILKSLDQYCAKATFFMLGKAAAASPSTVQQVKSKGHTIATHTYSHPNLTLQPLANAKYQIDLGRTYVGRAVDPVAVSGFPKLFRYPNNVSNATLEAYVKSQGLIVISFDMSPLDWRNDPADVTFARLTRLMETNDRGIIVLHDLMPNTANLVPMLLKYMADKHYTAVQLIE